MVYGVRGQEVVVLSFSVLVGWIEFCPRPRGECKGWLREIEIAPSKGCGVDSMNEQIAGSLRRVLVWNVGRLDEKWVIASEGFLPT